MARKKKHDVICDECGHECSISHSTKESINYCPFCGDPVHPIAGDEAPLLNDFDALDDFDEMDYYREDEDDGDL